MAHAYGDPSDGGNALTHMACDSSTSPLWRCRFEPKVDWVELRVILASPSQFRHVRDRLPAHWRRTFIHPEEGQHSSRIFTFRVQDPEGPDAVLRELQVLAPEGGAIGEEDIVIKGVEVALDAYLDDDGPVSLADVAFYMAWHLARPPEGQLLITEPRRYRAAAQARTTRQALAEGWTLNCGARDADDGMRAYVKQHDTRDGLSYASLPAGEHRARLERRLMGSAAPFRTIGEWRAFRFEKLAPLFYMCMPDPGASDFMKLLHSAAGPLGKPDAPGKRAGHRRLSRPGTRRDAELNDSRIRVALRKLTTAQRCGKSDGNGRSRTGGYRGEVV